MSLAPLLTDTEGRIKSIAIVWGLGDDLGSGHKSLENSIPGYFLRSDVDVVMVASDPCRSADLRIGGLMNKRAERLSYVLPHEIAVLCEDAGFADDLAFEDWLWRSLPLTREFPIERHGSRLSLDVRDLSPIKVSEAQNKLRLESLDLHFECSEQERWVSPANGVEVLADSREELPEDGRVLNSRTLALNHFFQHVRTQWLDWDIGFKRSAQEIIDYRRVCASGNALGNLLKPYPQDWFHVRKGGSKRAEVFFKDYSNNVNDFSVIRDYFSRLFPQTDWGDSYDSLPIQGGNMFVSGKYAFIGGDSKWRDSLSESNLRPLIFGTGRVENSIVWLGTEDDRPRLYYDGSGYQPVYHIDLFFHPIGFLNNDGDKKFTFLFASPSEETLIPRLDSVGPELQGLFIFFEETFNRLCDQLKALELEPDPIHIPLALELRTPDDEVPTENHRGPVKVTGYSPFANGLVQTHDGKVEYLMPHFVTPANPTVIHGLQSNAVDSINNHHESVRVIPVFDNLLNSQNLSDASLRCRVKVLEREFSK